MQCVGSSTLPDHQYATLTNPLPFASTLELDQSELPADVINDGLDHRIHSLMPPSFHAEQITQMNYAIH
jgi:hypothetical protein